MTIPFLTCSVLDTPSIGHGFFGRQGGVSQPPYDRLNCSFRQNDSPSAVRQNFQQIATTLNCKIENFAVLNQVHGATVHIETTPRFPSQSAGDAMVTACPGLVLSIITADCVPVLLADSQAQVIAAVHSGWQSAFLNIISKTIDTMVSLGAQHNRIVAAIGPCIQQQSYEVDDTFRNKFLHQSTQNQVYFKTVIASEKWFFNLPAYVKDQLKAKGVEKIEDCGMDTYGQSEMYFSHRYSSQKNQQTGRQLSVIYLK